MATMQAVYQTGLGDISTYKQGPQPRPTPGAGEVLIKVHAAALNPIDVHRHIAPVKDDFPVIVGYDVAGVVHAVGEGDVSGLTVGDRVFGDVMPESLGLKVSGSLAEFAVCQADLLARMPVGGDYVQYAALPVAAATAVKAFELAGVQKGQRVFISGGAGGVGLHAMQVAKAMYGAAEVATTASAGKFDVVKKYGADHVVDYRTQDAGEVLKGWADVVLDCTAETDMAKKVVKEGGNIVSILAFGVEGVTSFALAPTGELMHSVANMVAAGTLVPVIDTVYSMDDALKAVKHIDGGRSTGKVVVKVLEY